GADADPQPQPSPQQREVQPPDPAGQPGGEGEDAAVVAHTAEAGDQGDPGTGERREVDAVAGVLVRVVQVDQGRLAQVVVRQLQVPHLGGDHGLGAGRQRGVAYRAGLVVVEVAGLLLVGERIPAPVHGEHQVRLLDYLPAVEVE